MKINKKKLTGKKVLVRVDFNVPIVDGVITDSNRIIQALPTIEYLKENEAKIILFSHLGKVKNQEDLQNKSLKIVSEKLSKLIKQEVIFPGVTKGPILEEAISKMQNGDILLVENTRFEDFENKLESENDSQLAKYWASLGDGIFINDAFGTAHRAHASNVGIATYSKELYAGNLLEKEIKYIGGVINEPKTPVIAILGGSKVSDKILLIENLTKNADFVLIGGGMMFTFLAAMGIDVGKSLVEEKHIDLAKKILENSEGKIVLPIDVALAYEFKNETFEYTDITEIKPDMMGLDIGPKTIQLFNRYIQTAKTIIWNGPMGVFEFTNFAAGTKGICENISQNSKAISIIGGGDSAAAAINFGYADKFTHISTGGGSTIEYLEGKELPAIAILSEKP